MKNKSVTLIGVNLFMINAFIYITLSQFSPYLTPYYSKVGINAVLIGILSTIGPMVAIFVQPIWAVISDRTGRRKDILSLVVLGSGISMFCYYIGRTFLTFFIASFLLSIFMTAIVPLSDAISIRNAHKYQFDFAKIRMGGTIGFAVMVIISGIIVKQNPPIMFFLGFIGYMILLFFVRKLPEEENHEAVVKRVNDPVKSKKKITFLEIFELKQIIFILAFALISQIGISFHFSFLGVYMANMGLNESTIGFINCVAALSELPVLLLINRLMRKFSSTKIILISCFLVSLRIITVTGGSIIFFALAQALHGITFMTIYYSCAVYISKNVKPENQSKGQSTLAIMQMGIGSIVGNIVGGYLVDSFGLNSAFRFMAIFIIIATGIIAIIQFFYLKRKS